ncbi:hypothetical protein SEA_CARON_61 [Microbacterium phage Caron]|uniref:Uncharacterized protein n=1 Tax=Microbacterium phage Caron TaxID=3028494 RepID=A0AAF0CK93_9CAUD|nr:hypothetical protein SEA_CARON_61 [Microbacterium phage Caron]
MTTTTTIHKGDRVRVGERPETGTVLAVAPAELGGPLYAIIRWEEAKTVTSWRIESLTVADDLADATFSPETVDYAALRAERLYPADIRDGVDLNGSARAAYARGYADGLEAATP